MEKKGNLIIWFLKQYLVYAFFITLFFFVFWQIYLLLFPNESVSLKMILTLTFFVLFISVATSFYFGIYRIQVLRDRLRELSTFLSTLRSGKFPEPLKVTIKDEIGIIAEEINEIAKLLEEKVLSLQRLADEKSTLHQQVHAAAVMEERQRLARELHDSISQQLFALSMMSSASIRMLQQNSPYVKKQLEEIAEIAGKAQGEMRALLLHLRPVDLSGESLCEGIISLIKELKEKTNLSFHARVDEIENLPLSVEQHLFRIVQEALSNILRHSNADQVKLFLTERDQYIHLFIEDNGQGFDINEEKKVSYGIKTMRERCDEIGGIFNIRSKKGSGTYIDIRIPFPKRDKTYDKRTDFSS